MTGCQDDTRSWRTDGEQHIWKAGNKGQSAYFTTINRNKQSVTLDLKHPKGREILLQLARGADVVIDNFIPGKMEELGIGYEQLSGVNPSVIHASISGYGKTGPYSRRAGYDAIAAAEGGLLHITGEPDGRPMRPGLGLTDMCTGLYMHGAILAALRARDESGQGQQIDTSLFETQVSLLTNVAMSWLNGGQKARRWGTGHPSIVPYGCFRTADSYLVVGAVNDRQFARLCRLLGQERLARDPRFVDNDARVRNRAALDGIVDGLLSAQKTERWLQVFEGSGMPYGPVNSMEQVFSHPQTAARGMVHTIQDESAMSGQVQVLGIPVKFGHDRPSIRSKAPGLGEHTASVLAELGYDAEAISQLRRDGVV
ncbi:hypothetical protein CDD83_7411 [Cordyceps sp. RAO-2017]|nr:hypothetical protein CDD83_7411 [Cordyceps sp. RAO-2017]